MIQRLCTLYFACKRLILLKKSDLSTEKTAFTITTIFIYRSIVNRQKKRKSGDISKKHAKSIKKKANGDITTDCQTVFQESTGRLLQWKNNTRARSLLIEDTEQCQRNTSNMPLQQEKPRFLRTGVDKCLHIHRMRCGKSRSLSTSQFLSQTSPP